MSDDRERIDRLEKRQDKLEDIHVETISKIGDLVTELRVTNENNKHVNRDIEELKSTQKSMQKDLVQMGLQQAENKPMIDLVKGLNNRIWMLIAVAVAGALATVGSLQLGG